MTRLLILLVMLSSLLCVPPIYADEEDEFSEERILQIIYSDFLALESFAYIGVRLEGEAAEEIGLDSEELTKFLRLKYKNNFAGFPFKEPGEEFLDKLDDKDYMSKIGRLFVQVWIVGTDYPVAYHVEISAGSYENLEQYETASLGYGSKDSVPDTVKKVINDMVEELAITFFRVRGEL